MAKTYSNELETILNTIPATFPDGRVHGGRMRRYRATIDLASQAASDTIVLARVPEYSVFAHMVVNTDTSLGTATIAVGDDDDPDLYKSAATLTATNAPTMYARNLGLQEGPIAAQKEISLTVGTAALPASGKLFVDLYFSQA